MKDKIIIPDTNFIRAKGKDFEGVLTMLSKVADVFIAQITIDERIAQARLKLISDYEEIEKTIEKHRGLAEIKIKKGLAEKLKEIEAAMITHYKKTFGKNIIPFPIDETTFANVLERAYKKIAPFTKGGSDNGLKDTLLWLSLLEFFKTNGDNKEIILITDDGDFVKSNLDGLQKEFLAVTKKNIHIVKADYYNSLIGVDTPKEVVATIQNQLSDIERNELRNEINMVIENICFVEETDNNWNTYPSAAFAIGRLLTVEAISKCFANLEKLLADSIFDKDLFVSKFLLDIPIEDKLKVDMLSFDALLSLYKKVSTNYKDYLQQFFQTACNIINQRYSKRVIDYDDLPF